MLSRRTLAFLLLFVVLTRAQELSSELQIAEAPAVEVVPNALAANATVANAAGTNNVGGAGGGSLFGNADGTPTDPFAPETPRPAPSPNVNTTAAGGGRRRLMSYKKRINKAERARRALKQTQSIPVEPSAATIVVGRRIRSSSTARRTLLLLKPKNVQPAAVSVANVLKKLKYEKKIEYKFRDINSGAKLAFKT